MFVFATVCLRLYSVCHTVAEESRYDSKKNRIESVVILERRTKTIYLFSYRSR